MPMTPKLGIDVTYHEGVPWRRHVILESREKLKLLYLHHYGTYAYKTWKDGDST